jgi:hypothetical protein
MRKPTLLILELVLLTLAFVIYPVTYRLVDKAKPITQQKQAQTIVQSAGATYYVSRAGSNSDGRSWASAWNNLDQINWNIIQPGDTLLLDGGAPEMIYTATLTIQKSGAANDPITIRMSSEPGRDGKVVIDGGLTYWPCQASEPSPYPNDHPAGTRQFGIDLNRSSWIAIDGTKPSGIEIRNHNQEGVVFRGAQHIRLSQLHIHHNTYATQPNGSGIDISGDSIILEQLDIHHNGQDAIQGGNLTNLVLQDSYLHDHYCRHPDGIQLNYGTNSDITIQRNVFTEFLQAIFLGEANVNALSSTSKVYIRYNLIYRATYGIKSHNDSNKDWEIYNNTLVDISEQGIHLYRMASGAKVRNNILYNSGYVLRNGAQSHNLFYNAAGAPRGDNTITEDPLFVDRERNDYRLRMNSPAIDRGVPVGQNRDLPGNTVPSGKGVDIGAFEVVSHPPGTLYFFFPLINA